MSNRVVDKRIHARDRRPQMFMQQTTSGVRCRLAASHLIDSASCGAQMARGNAAPAVRHCCTVVRRCGTAGGRRRCRNHRLSSGDVEAVDHRSRRPAGGREPRHAAARCRSALCCILQARTEHIMHAPLHKLACSAWTRSEVSGAGSCIDVAPQCSVCGLSCR